MRFKHGDELLAMMVARPDAFVFTATDGGYAKRTPIDEYPVQGRGGQGVLTAKLTDDRGGLVGALMVDAGDEVFAITSSGGVIRTRADEVRPTSRATMGVRLINLGDGDAVVGVTRNAESAAGVDDIDDAEVENLIDADLSGGAAGRTAAPSSSDDNESDGATDSGTPRDGGSVTGTQGDSPSDPATDSAADPEQGDS
jgi:DNA gyrase subunit A